MNTYKRSGWTVVGVLTLAALLVWLGAGCGSSPKSAPSVTDTGTKPVGLEEPKLDPSSVPITAFFPMKGAEKREFTLSAGLKTARLVLAASEATSSGSLRVQHVTTTRYDFDAPPTKDGPAPTPKPVATIKETYLWDPNKGLLLNPGLVNAPGPTALRILPNKWGEELCWEDKFTAKDPNGRSVPGKAFGKLSGPERVATPAGDFDTIHTEITRVAGSGNAEVVENFEFWFAKDVGIVKSLYTTRNGKLSMLLSKRGL